MNRLQLKQKNQKLRAERVRHRVRGTPDVPRLAARISNRNVFAQLIDDTSGKTLLEITSVSQKAATGPLTAKAAWVGSAIGKKAAAKKIKRVVFDRGSKLYHGRIQALAEAARKEGLEF